MNEDREEEEEEGKARDHGFLYWSFLSEGRIMATARKRGRKCEDIAD